MKLPFLAPLLLLSVAITAPAQNSVLRGEVEEFENDSTRFLLEDTRIELRSTFVNLAQLVSSGNQRLEVEFVSAAPNPIVRVLSATPEQERFEFEPLIEGQTTAFEVAGPAGAAAVVFLDVTANTSFFPFGVLGSWVLGPSPIVLGQTAIRPDGEGEILLPIPAQTNLVGVRFTGQALIIDGANSLLTNPDSEVVRN